MLVDGVSVATTTTLSAAVLLWAICHIFAQHARGASRGPLMFLQRYVLDVEDATRVPVVCDKKAAYLGLPKPC